MKAVVRLPDASPRAAVVIPAFNEADRIGTVLRAVTASCLADEIVVVSDGSVDRTADVARRYDGVRVVELPFNMGKGGAMVAGVEAASAPIVAFVDADLQGLEPYHVDSIIEPLLDDECDMCVGVFRGGKFWSDAAQKIAPCISGQRAMKRWVLLTVPQVREMGMGVETAINEHVRRTKARVLRVVLHGVSNYPKERKLGLVKGVRARARMYQEIGQAMVRARKRRRRRGQWLGS